LTDPILKELEYIRLSVNDCRDQGQNNAENTAEANLDVRTGLLTEFQEGSLHHMAVIPGICC
jgi:hypothetical protein